MPGAVVGAPREDGGGGRAPELDPVGLGAPIGENGEVVDELRVQIGLLRGKEGDERVVRGQRDRGLHRGAVGSGAKTRVTLVAADDGVHGVEDRDVHDGHRPTRSPRSDLFSEDSAVAGRHRCVVEAAGIDGDLVPVAEPVDGARPGTPVLSEIAQVRSSSEAGPEDLTETAGESIGAGATGQAEGERPQQERAAGWSTHHGALLSMSHLGPGRSEREQPACQICRSGGDRNLREFGPAQALECRAQRHRVTPVGHSTPHDAILENDHGDKARKRPGGAVALLEVAVSEIREQPAAGDHARPQDEREPAREPRRERRPCARVPLADQAERPQVEEPGVEPGRDE